ncbi:MAG TPA: hypothetical protein VJJ24_00835 [Candidatus Paceibacterota bacterium]
MNSKFVLIAVVVALLGLGVGYYIGYDHGFEGAIIGEDYDDDDGGTGTRPVACTEEAKICPDGSAVGRVGLNCEFAACPGSSGSGSGGGGGGILPYNSGITGIVMLGPTCPVMRDPPDPQCADRPYSARLHVTNAGMEPAFSSFLVEFTSDSNGRFNVSLPPGSYEIRSAVAANVLPYCSSDIVTVGPNTYTQTTVYCDSGIR